MFVRIDTSEIDDKAVMPALEAVVGTAPDVRVFNFSFGDKRPLADYGDVERRERLILVQDLDNFIFARDVVVVVAAGNSPPGVVPTKSYPDHLDEPAWQLGAWPSGFNSIACGSFVGKLHPDGLVTTIGWPSPMTRVGPGIASSPKPEFGADGGNLTADWKFRASLGVWGCSSTGLWEDRAGTSFSAPLLAREAAFAFKQLQAFCAPGSRPFGVTVKALLALSAERKAFPSPVKMLADRTIGRGYASAHRLVEPRADSAVFLWQGVIADSDDVVRVQLPIPKEWLEQARNPAVRLVCSWDPPVNEAVQRRWACRRVEVQLRPAPGAPAFRGSHNSSHDSYPIIDRTYNLSTEKRAKVQSLLSDWWTVELSYTQIAEYASGITFAPQQRVAFVAELVDQTASPLSPQELVQLLPGAAKMVRLSSTATAVPMPILVKRS